MRRALRVRARCRRPPSRARVAPRPVGHLVGALARVCRLTQPCADVVELLLGGRELASRIRLAGSFAEAREGVSRPREVLQGEPLLSAQLLGSFVVAPVGVHLALARGNLVGAAGDGRQLGEFGSGRLRGLAALKQSVEDSLFAFELPGRLARRPAAGRCARRFA